MKDREIRTFQSDEMRVVRAEGEAPKIVGHAAVFDSPTKINGWLGGFVEEIAPGAFTESIAQDDIRGLFNHDSNLVLGRNTAGTLTLEEDDIGLRYEIDPPDSELGQSLLKSIERKDITGSSFGFSVQKQEWTEDDDSNEPDRRRILKCKLYDVSPVTFPAFEDTDVAVRARKEWRTALGLPTDEEAPEAPAVDAPAEGSKSNLEKMEMRRRLST